MIPKSVNHSSVKNIRNSLKQDFHKYTAFAYPPLYHQFFDIHRVIHLRDLDVNAFHQTSYLERTLDNDHFSQRTKKMIQQKKKYGKL